MQDSELVLDSDETEEDQERRTTSSTSAAPDWLDSELVQEVDD